MDAEGPSQLPNAARVVGLLDADAFFAECERLADPHLIGKPVLVVADAKRRGVVLTASYEARAFGVKTGMVLGAARRCCPGAVVVEGHMPLYLDVSARMDRLLRQYTDLVEMSSVDEAYFDLTGVLSYFRRTALNLCREIQTRIRRDVGVPVTIGIGPNKLIAKLLADLSKPEGLREILAENVPALLEQTPVRKLCGVGSRLESALARFGVRTAADLGRLPADLLLERFGVVGWSLKRMGLGLDDRLVKHPDESEPVKSVGHAHTLPRDSADSAILHSFLVLLSEKVAARLRRYGLAGRVVHTAIRTAAFVTLSRQRRLSVPISAGRHIFGAARVIFEELWNAPPVSCGPLRLLGVTVSDLSPTAAAPSLLPDCQKTAAVDAAVDALNARFGSRTIRRAAELSAEQFGILPTPIPPRIR